MLPARHPDLLSRSIVVGLGTAAVGLVLAVAGLQLWGFVIAALLMSPAVRWVVGPDLDAHAARLPPADAGPAPARRSDEPTAHCPDAG